MSFADAMEKSVFFKIIRWFAFFFSLCGFLLIVCGVLVAIINSKDLFPGDKVTVKFKEIQIAAASKNIETFNLTAKSDIKNAYTAAQALYGAYPTNSISTIQMLEKVGFRKSDGVQLDILNGDRNTLTIRTKHKNGDTTYVVDAAGSIKEETSGNNKRQQVVKGVEGGDKRIGELINQAVAAFPKELIDQEKLKEILKTKTSSLKKDYQISFLTGFIDVVKQAPKDDTIFNYANEYMSVFFQKVAESDDVTNSMIAYRNIAISLGSVFAGILIIAMFGLVLVLLSIERNTRRIQQ